jgi:hypothetical protein
MFAFDGWNVFVTPAAEINSLCKEGRSDRWCEVGKFMLSLIPAAFHGAVLGLVGGVVAIVFLLFAWRLLRGGNFPSDRSVDKI